MTQSDVDAGQIVNTATADSDQTGPAQDTETVIVSGETPGGATTRTQGFWSTHPEFAEQTWLAIPAANRIIGQKNLGDGSNDVEEMMGGFWSNISKKATGKGKSAKRSPMDQARMQLLQQLLAAMLNAQAFGTDDGGLVAVGRLAFSGTDRDLILVLAESLTSFNEGGDVEPLPTGVDQGSANPKAARRAADKAFWDTLP